ncbi:MAG: peptidase [Bacteroidetes bacterium]|nr:peptidase [Bacteroidota bacterium]
MKKYILLLFLFCLCTSGLFAPAKADESADQAARMKNKAAEALAFCKKNNYNTDFCVLIDMKIHSGKKRAYLWNFKSDSVLLKGMCSHGCGQNPWSGTSTKEKPEFSNVPDSHCSSLGKYKVSKRGTSAWGIKVNYLLIGLEATNSNAVKREIVLHSWEDVPAYEVYPSGVPEGWGCPAVSNAFMTVLDEKLKASQKPVLLWIFN